MDFNHQLERYAQLIVRHGMNVQRGQLVTVSAEAYHRELAYLVARESYQAGAAFVQIDLSEPRLQPLRIAHSTEDDMRYVPQFITPKYQELVDARAATVSLVGMEDPDLLTDADPRKVNVGRMALYQARKHFYEEGIGKSRVHWTVAAAATPKWASRVFPGEDPQRAERRLWEQLFTICRLDQDDFLAAWRRHNDALHARAAWLTSLGIERLVFQGPGTDLRVGLSRRARFKAGGEPGPWGVEFEPNLPTEECFTTPDWRTTEGTVAATRPFFINGTLIRDLTLRFAQGEVVEFHASAGEATFREYLESDAGARRLGEVALVGIDSPVYRSGLVFQEILLDENAACHIAIGSAYKFCLDGGDTLDAQSLRDIGCNESSVHTDIMISSEKVDVHADTYDGARVVLLRAGEWVRQ